MTMVYGGIAMAVGSLISAYLQSQGAKSAANAQANAANNATNMQWNMFQQQQANQQPWLDAGKWSLGEMQNGMQSGRWTNSMNPMFTMPSNWQTDPGYQFTLQQGQQALQRSAAARGGALGGGSLKALDQYNQGMASNQYGNVYNRLSGAYGDAWNRITANNANDYNRYASMAGLGQTAANSINASGSNAANQIGQNMLSIGNAQAANSVVQGNIWGNAATGLGNVWGQYQMMNGGYHPNYTNLGTSSPYWGTAAGTSGLDGAWGAGVYI